MPDACAILLKVLKMIQSNVVGMWGWLGLVPLSTCKTR